MMFRGWIVPTTTVLLLGSFVNNEVEAAAPAIKCNANEVLNVCPAYGTVEDTCEKLLNGSIAFFPAPPPNYVCQPRCDCMKGYVRINGSCVPAVQCCNFANAIIVDCPLACQDTCYLYADPACLVTPCFNKTCRCKPGYIKDVNGVCVSRMACPRSCKGDPNAIPVPCGDSCPVTCANRFNPSKEICIPKCIVNGCKCKPGYVLNKGKCVLEKDCPICHNANQIYADCAPQCPPKCPVLNGNQPMCMYPNAKCTTACECISGYYRNASNACVSLMECPPFRCSDMNRVYSQCGDACPRRCDNVVNGGKTYCMGLCYPACVCKPGLLINSLGKCVAPSACPKTCIGANMVYKAKHSGCPITCDNYSVYAQTPCNAPNAVGCVCQDGYVLDENNDCVPISQCSPSTR